MTTAAVRRRPLHGLSALVRGQIRYCVFAPALLAFSVGLPVVMYFMFGAGQSYSNTWQGNATVSAAVMFGMGTYGATLAAASIGAQVGIERRQGWNRQLALTPVRPSTNFAVKIIFSLASAALSLGALLVCGAVTNAQAHGWVWVASPALTLAGCVVASAMGIAIGYLVRTDAAYSVIGGGSAIVAFLAGAWIPLDQMPDFFQSIAPYTPMYGTFQLAQSPATGAPVHWGWIANMLGWGTFAVGIAMWRIRSATDRA